MNFRTNNDRLNALSLNIVTMIILVMAMLFTGCMADMDDMNTESEVLETSSEELRYYRAQGDVEQITTGSQHACARTSTGRIYCWGDTTYGQVGTGVVGERQETAGSCLTRNITVADTPKRVRLSGVVDVAAGSQHTCAVTSDGSAYCWGFGRYGQLGRFDAAGECDAPSAYPVEVEAPSVNFVQIEAGESYTCALSDTDEMYCWGRNYGQFGISRGTLSASLTPTATGRYFSDITGGPFHLCGTQADGSGSCLGSNSQRQVSDEVSRYISEPASVGFVDDFAVGNSHTCSIDVGTAQCWGDDRQEQLGEDLDDFNFFAISGGRNHSCAIDYLDYMWGGTELGRAYCWGDNMVGQLGNGTTSRYDDPTPVQVRSSSYLIDIESGSDFSCAITVTRDAVCWGGNVYGQLGNGETRTVQNLPTTVVNLPSARSSLVAAPSFSLYFR